MQICLPIRPHTLAHPHSTRPMLRARRNGLMSCTPDTSARASCAGMCHSHHDREQGAAGLCSWHEWGACWGRACRACVASGKSRPVARGLDADEFRERCKAQAGRRVAPWPPPGMSSGADLAVEKCQWRWPGPWTDILATLA